MRRSDAGTGVPRRQQIWAKSYDNSHVACSKGKHGKTSCNSCRSCRSYRASPHPQFDQNNGTSNDGAVFEQVAHALFHGGIAAAAEKVDPTGGVDQRHSGISRTRKESSCAAVMKVDESPKRSAKDRMRPRRAKSPKAASTAARLVFAPETRMASSKRSVGISKVVFIR